MGEIQSKACALLLGALSLSSCDTTDLNKSQVGAMLGGVLGGAVGGTIAKDNRALGTATGAVLGAGVGYAIGKRLDQRDRASLEAKVREAAERQPTDAPATWQSDHSGATATITAADVPKPIEITKSISKEPEVTIEGSRLRFASGLRQAIADVNVRLGPGIQYAVKDVLRQGQSMNVLGMSEEGWYLIANGNTAVGYVSGRYLQRPGSRSVVAARQVAAPVETKPQLPQRKVEAAPRPERTTEELDVRIAGTCRPVHVRVRNSDGQVTEETVTTCQNPDGSWGA